MLCQATPMASFLDVEIFISSLDKIFTFSVTALNIRNRKQAEINNTQKGREIMQSILIAHFYPNSSFLEVTFLHQVFVFNIDHVREGKGIY